MSRSPEVAHSCSPGFEELHRVDELRQFRCSDGNSALGERADHVRNGFQQ